MRDTNDITCDVKMNSYWRHPSLILIRCKNTCHVHVSRLDDTIWQIEVF